MVIYFLSSNQHKITEVTDMLNSKKLTVKPVLEPILEIQSQDMDEIVTDKVIKAFEKIGRPLIVEQTGLLLHDLGGLPGGLTQIFWDSLQADKFSDYFASSVKINATAKTVVGFCDGREIRLFSGEIDGTIVNPPRGNRAFQWDCIFQPEGFNETFAEMGDRKKDISMRKKALEKLKVYLEAKYV